MSKRNYLLAILFLLLAFHQVEAQEPIPTRGDDAATGGYGYRWRTSEDTQDPFPFSWIDISDGTPITGISDDNFVGPIPIGFKFKYYWLEYDELFMGTNGYVMFARAMNIASDTEGFPTFPTEGPATSPNNFIGIWLSDLTFTDSSHAPIPNAKAYYKTISTPEGKKFVLTYENVPFWTNDNPEHYSGSNTFQLVLSEDGKIVINYKNCRGPVASSYTRPGMNYITIGMENITGRLGLNIAKNVLPPRGGSPAIQNLSIEITPPTNPTYVFKDVMTEWVFNKENGGIFRSAGGDPYRIQASIKNTGTSAITSPAIILVTQRIIDFFGGNRPMRELYDTLRITNLQPGESRLIAFNKPFVAGKRAIGTYRVFIKTSLLGGDDFSTNDELEGEIVVVDTTKSPIELGYDRHMFRDLYPQQVADPDPRAGEMGGGLEVGMSFEPPFYPAEVTELIFHYAVFNNGDRPDTLVGFKTKVYKNNGPGGTVGSTPIFSKVIEGSYYEDEYLPETGRLWSFFRVVVPVSPKIILNRGEKLFVSHVPRQPSTEDSARRRMDFLINETAIGVPTSFRSYEITGGIWAPYRSRATTDFAIRIGIAKPTSRDKELVQNYAFLEPNYPNPANEQTIIPYKLLQPANVKLEVRNLLGQLVELRELGFQVPGNYSIELSTQNYVEGVYTYTLWVNDHAQTQKMIIIK
ncbi:MAG: T9SS type A sorting domain-containing protein [Bacteroidia bacterium]|nr:T9SS type A sorting domain-containing protein [Bacteroidia bacterium]MDW8158486.1 T9SS type A sorting domain-containing protein [Bacteroidia bacterium]